MNFAHKQLEPFGLMISSHDAGADPGAVLVEEIKDLLKRHKMLVLRGFARLEGDAFSGYCSNFGEILEWDFGAINELRPTVNAQNYLYTNREVPFHWDGAFAGKVPEWIFFHCDTAPMPETGGETIFADTGRMLELADSRTKIAWSGVEITYSTEK